MANSDLGALLLWLTWTLHMGPEQALATAICILLACGAEPSDEPPARRTTTGPPAAPAA